MEKNQEFLSLYDYLNRPAGKELGKQVAAEAKATNQPIKTRDVETLNYKGKVYLYTREFLNEYFTNTTPDIDLDILPF
jgi:hypothetical protein